MGETIEVGYELDQWERQGTTRHINVDPEDYRGINAENIEQAVYREIRRDAEQNLYFIYPESEVVQQILDALASGDEKEDVEVDSHA